MTIFGAIRWDGVYADGGWVKTAVENSLSPSQYHWRAPFWATVTERERIALLPTQQTMDDEIAAAVAGGLDYWAFLLYPREGEPGEEPGMMNGYDLFQTSAQKNDINWCMIRQIKNWGAPSDYTAKVEEAVGQCLQPNYQMVLGNRPLVYVYGASQKGVDKWWGGSFPALKASLDAFRAGCITAGLGNPYIVAMASAPIVADALLAKTQLGCDAVTVYARGSNEVNGTFTAGLASYAEAFWVSLATACGQIVPLCMDGWDRRPMIQRPMRSQATTQRSYFGMNRYTERSTDAEFVAHVQSALNYVAANPAVCPADAVLCYAWNEHAEGGWLCPSLDDPTGARLAALAAIL